MQGAPAGWPQYPQHFAQPAAPPVQPYHYASAGGPDDGMDGGALDAAQLHAPSLQPVQTNSPPALPLEPQPTLHNGDIDNEAQWMGIWAVGSGVVLSMALLGWLAIVNKREHEDLELKIEGVDQRLLDYRQAHSLVHSVLQSQMAAMQAATAATAASVQGVAHPQATMYGAPAGFPPFIPPQPAPPPPTTVYVMAPPAGMPMQYASTPPAPITLQATPVGAAAAPIPPTRQFALPPHLEHAVVSSGRAAARAASRAASVPTRLGLGS